MATPAMPLPATPGPQPGPSGPVLAPQGAQPQGASALLSSFQSLPPMQKLAFLAMASDKLAAESPETAPMMREVQKQAQTATMKLIQQRQQAQQKAPQI